MTTARWCDRCNRPARVRGEPRAHVWLCGCYVVPDRVGKTVTVRGDTVWYAMGEGVTASHPLRDGAISEWRRLLELWQRDQDTPLPGGFKLGDEVEYVGEDLHGYVVGVGKSGKSVLVRFDDGEEVAYLPDTLRRRRRVP